METLVHSFKDHFELSIGGEKVKAESISLPSPNNYVIKQITVLDQEFSKAMMSMSEKSSDAEPDKDAKITGKEIFMMMSAGGAKLPACFDAIKQICLKQGKINDQASVTDHIFNQMSFRDTKELLGGYVNSFLFSSLVD